MNTQSPQAAAPPQPAEAEEPELIAMRSDERLDALRVGQALEGRLPGAQGTPQLLQFGGGKANLTYLLRWPQAAGGFQEWVLRRPPLGPLAPRAHDMEREYRVLSRLYQAYPLAPRAVFFSAEASIAGAPFLIMERRSGVVIRHTMPPQWQDAQAAQRISTGLVDALAALHRIRPAEVGLESLGRPQGFMQRQLQGWGRRWEAAQVEDTASTEFQALLEWLQRRIPPPQRACLVHNDFKLDNMMLHAKRAGEVVAVLDWDMCTLGDPLADLGGLLGYWTEAGDSEARRSFAVMPSAAPGFLTRRQAAQRYGERTGLDPAAAALYEVFGVWRTAVIIQQIYARFHRGQTQDTRFASYAGRAASLVQAAAQLAESLGG